MRDLIEKTNPQWHEILDKAISFVDKDYLTLLSKDNLWLPGKHAIFAAFSQPLYKTQYLMLGESPYPRQASANGYAFWDNAVQSLWSSKGLSKEVNRATSLRNIIKMLLVARGCLTIDCSQSAIAALDKSLYWQTLGQLFNAILNQGFLLLNACLVYREGQVPYHARQWQPFMKSVLQQLEVIKPDLELILFGKMAAQIDHANRFKHIVAEHPYNLSFITNPKVLAFFRPFDLLRAYE